MADSGARLRPHKNTKERRDNMLNLKNVAMHKLAMEENKTALEEEKAKLRAGAKVSGKGYASLRFDDQVNYNYSPEHQKMIDDFCAKHGIEKVKTVIPNYKVVITPTPKAIDEYNKSKAKQ